MQYPFPRERKLPAQWIKTSLTFPCERFYICIARCFRGQSNRKFTSRPRKRIGVQGNKLRQAKPVHNHRPFSANKSDAGPDVNEFRSNCNYVSANAHKCSPFTRYMSRHSRPGRASLRIYEIAIGLYPYRASLAPAPS